MRMREAMREINRTRGGEDLALNIGLHSGPCLAVMLDDRQDYFGQTVNIASRVNELADPTAILATKPIIESSEVAQVLRESRYRTTPRSSQLRGLSDEFEIFEVREREAVAAAE
jgi:class 3 adenylate cyclase